MQQLLPRQLMFVYLRDQPDHLHLTHALMEDTDRLPWHLPAAGMVMILITHLSTSMDLLLHAEWCKLVLLKDMSDRKKMRE